MRASDFCRRLIESPSVEEKLRRPPSELEWPEEAADILRAPGRSEGLRIREARAVKVPPIIGMADASQRARILHALANHELQAIELFAWAVLAFPATPLAFRRGLLGILAEEQTHLGLYLDRLSAHGVAFGDHGVTGHFWNQLNAMATPIEFLCAMGLTFENANLDFAQEYARAATEAGDDETAAALAVVHRDEERHVRFAYHWLVKLKPAEETPLAAYEKTIRYPLGIARARGKTFDRASRERAGLDRDFIDALDSAAAVRPSGAPR